MNRLIQLWGQVLSVLAWCSCRTPDYFRHSYASLFPPTSHRMTYRQFRFWAWSIWVCKVVLSIDILARLQKLNNLKLDTWKLLESLPMPLKAPDTPISSRKLFFTFSCKTLDRFFQYLHNYVLQVQVFQHIKCANS